MKTLRNGKPVILSFLLLLASLSPATSAQHEPISGINIKLLDGQEITVSQFTGNKPVYLKFWASYCQECLQQMPHLQETYENYAKDVEVIAVNLGIDDDEQSVLAIKEKYGLTVPLAIDTTGELARAVDLRATPLHILIDEQGKVVYKNYVDTAGIDQRLALIKAGRPLAVAQQISQQQSVSAINTDSHSKKPTALFFLATWCDWYLEESRPETSENCIAAQQTINQLHAYYPGVSWVGIATRLWTEAPDVEEYKKKFSVPFPVTIDSSNDLTFAYRVKNYPTLILLKDGDEIYRSTRVDYAETVTWLNEMLQGAAN